jgi:hypothetical protein
LIFAVRTRSPVDERFVRFVYDPGYDLQLYPLLWTRLRPTVAERHCKFCPAVTLSNSPGVDHTKVALSLQT